MGKNSWKTFLRRPRGWFVAVAIFLCAVSAAGSTVIAINGIPDGFFGALAYALFAVAAASLGYSVYLAIVYAPTVKRAVTNALKSRVFTANVLENYDFKTFVFAAVSTVITLGFAAMNLAGAIRYRTLWYYAISAYYVVLVLFRGGILLGESSNRKRHGGDELRCRMTRWRLYLASGAAFVLLELVMTAVVTESVLSRRPLESGEIMTIANAAYTFWKMSLAVYNLVKSRKFADPVTLALRNVSFADACTSMVSLTVIMLSTFGGGDDLVAIKAGVSFAACAVILALAATTIVTAKRKLDELKRNGLCDVETASGETVSGGENERDQSRETI